jgi:hypothetical protein
MEPLILLIAVLVCPVVMGTAMLLMWREMRRGNSPTPAADSPSPPEEKSQSHPEMESKQDEADARHGS